MNQIDATNDTAAQWERLADWEQFLTDLDEVQAARGEVIGGVVS